MREGFNFDFDINDDSSLDSEDFSERESDYAGGIRQGDGDVLLYGEDFAGTLLQMRDLFRAEGTVFLEGRIFGEICNRPLELGGTTRCLSFDITDFTSSVTVYVSLEEQAARALEKRVYPGLWVRVRGEVDRLYPRDILAVRILGLKSFTVLSRWDTAPEKRVELHVHTNLCRIPALTRPDQGVLKAQVWGHRAVGITDLDSIQALPEALAAARSVGIKLLPGCELTVLWEEDDNSFVNTPFPITVFARNEQGLRDIYSLLTELYSITKGYQALPLARVLARRENLLLGSGSGEDFLHRFNTTHDPAEQEALVRSFDFLELAPMDKYWVYPALVESIPREPYISDVRRLVEAGERLGVPVVASGIVRYLEQDERESLDLLWRDSDLGFAHVVKGDYHFLTTQELLEEFSFLGQELARKVVITNTNRVADLCWDIPLEPRPFRYPCPPGTREELAHLVEERLRQLYGDHPHPLVQEILDKELSYIRAQGCEILFTLSRRIMEDAREKGYPVGLRGTFGGSLVAFLLGISETNPLPPHYRCPGCGHTDFAVRSDLTIGASLPPETCPVCGEALASDGYHIPLDTIYGFDGSRHPEVYLNVSGDYREQAVAVCEGLLGEDHVVPAGVIVRYSRRKAMQTVESLRVLSRYITEAELRRLAAPLIGLKNYDSTHAGTVFLVPEDRQITDYTPLDEDGTHLDQMDLSLVLPKLNLLNYDYIDGLKTLSELGDVDLSTIPTDDRETMALFTSSAPLGLEDPVIGPTGTLGVPEFGTDFTRQMLVDTEPRDLDDLIRLAALAHSTGAYLGCGQDLILEGEASLKELISTRDDILLTLTERGMDRRTAFSIMEATRKGRIARDGLRDAWREALEALDLPDWYTEALGKIEYLFPRAHAAAYALNAYRWAWCKVHRPLAFYGAYFRMRLKSHTFTRAMVRNDPEVILGQIRRLEARTDNGSRNRLLTLRVVYEYLLRGYRFYHPVRKAEDTPTLFQLREDGLTLPSSFNN